MVTVDDDDGDDGCDSDNDDGGGGGGGVQSCYIIKESFTTIGVIPPSD